MYSFSDKNPATYVTSDIASPLTSVPKPYSHQTPSRPVVLHGQSGDLNLHETRSSHLESVNARQKISSLFSILPLVISAGTSVHVLMLMVFLLQVSLQPLILLWFILALHLVLLLLLN